MEAGDGIEPSHGAFAEPGLTTWLPRPSQFNGLDYAHSQRWHKVRQVNLVIRGAETEGVGSAKA